MSWISFSFKALSLGGGQYCYLISTLLEPLQAPQWPPGHDKGGEEETCCPCCPVSARVSEITNGRPCLCYEMIGWLIIDRSAPERLWGGYFGLWRRKGQAESWVKWEVSGRSRTMRGWRRWTDSPERNDCICFYDKWSTNTVGKRASVWTYGTRNCRHTRDEINTRFSVCSKVEVS